MTKDKEIKTLVPPLRFPEFDATEGWASNKINQLCKIGNGRDYKHLNAGDIPVYGSGGYMTSVDDYLHDGESVCIGRKGTIDKPIFLTGKFWTVDTLFYTYSFHKCLPKFLYRIFQQITWYKYNEAGGVPSLSKTTIGNIDILVPKNKKEQQKIVDCFDSLDNLINTVSDKIDALKEYKKGLMQQLFPVESKAIPALRFPEFKNAGEWKETTLGEEVFYENGKAHENDIDETGKYIAVNSKFISTDGEVVKCTNSPNCLAEEGDILMVLSDVPNGRAIAKCFVVDSNDRYTVNQRVCKLKPKKVVSLLLYYIINRNPYLLAFDDGVKQTNLKKEDVLKNPFKLPNDPKEQQKIADFLSSVDELISTETDKLNQLRAHKKGLMQQLFPNIKE